MDEVYGQDRALRVLEMLAFGESHRCNLVGGGGAGSGEMPDVAN
jgi:hypothetical protein